MGKLRKTLIGVTSAVVLYIVIFILAVAFKDASVIVPVELLVILLTFGIVGCLFMVFVMPVAVIIGEIGKKKEVNN